MSRRPSLWSTPQWGQFRENERHWEERGGAEERGNRWKQNATEVTAHWEGRGRDRERRARTSKQPTSWPITAARLVSPSVLQRGPRLLSSLSLQCGIAPRTGEQPALQGSTSDWNQTGKKLDCHWNCDNSYIHTAMQSQIFRSVSLRQCERHKTIVVWPILTFGALIFGPKSYFLSDLCGCNGCVNDQIRMIKILTGQSQTCRIEQGQGQGRFKAQSLELKPSQLMHQWGSHTKRGTPTLKN